MNIIKNFKTPKPFITSIIIACILVGYNIPVFLVQPSHNWLIDFGALLLLITISSSTIYLLSINKLLVRIITIPLVLISSAFLYFILFYKIIIYPPIIEAIFATDTNEALELFSLNAILWVSIFGLLPSYLILKLTKNINEAKKSKLILLTTIISVVTLFYFNICNIDSNLKPLRKNFTKDYPILETSYSFNKYLPYSYIYNAKFYFAKKRNYLAQKKINLLSKYKFTLPTKANKNSFLVIVIGESARADRFSLNGYKRNTNPLLSTQKNLASYTNAHALDTHTRGALPHIFLRDLKLKKADKKKESTFLPIFKSLGFKTFWFSNWRTQGTQSMYSLSLEADTIAYIRHLARYSSDPTNKIFYDQILLSPLKETVEKNKAGVIVLHTKGSHVTYYNRAPKKFHIYQPTCTSTCTSDLTSLNNAYDNTIVYTDFFLNEIINILKNKDAMLVYISDHGQSLGENGLFIHAAPFETAPKEQTHIPMILWASDKFLSNKKNSAKFEQIKSNFDKYVDQSYIFHSVLDCMGVKSNAIDKNKSICRTLK